MIYLCHGTHSMEPTWPTIWCYHVAARHWPNMHTATLYRELHRPPCSLRPSYFGLQISPLRPSFAELSPPPCLPHHRQQTQDLVWQSCQSRPIDRHCLCHCWQCHFSLSDNCPSRHHFSCLSADHCVTHFCDRCRPPLWSLSVITLIPSLVVATISLSFSMVPPTSTWFSSSISCWTSSV